MGDINIGSVSGGQHQWGANNTQNNYGSSPAEAVRLAGELVRQLQTEHPGLAGHAELVRSELVSAQEEGRALHQGRVRRWLDTIQAGVGTGSAALALAQAVGGAVGV
ncbi:hypothetical protein ACIHCQ_38830 [Streptomyces sp. NPDC052236]|uniref:hypothetical protein n=1 Tax=Streptomyces sp. NPDC052236 TaxID=3365686 RepID=UPI0037CF4A0D